MSNTFNVLYYDLTTSYMRKSRLAALASIWIALVIGLCRISVYSTAPETKHSCLKQLFLIYKVPHGLTARPFCIEIPIGVNVSFCIRPA
jgi:hypothetical protein